MALNPLLVLLGTSAKKVANSTIGQAVKQAATKKVAEVKNSMVEHAKQEQIRNSVLPGSLTSVAYAGSKEQRRAEQDKWLADNGYLEKKPQQSIEVSPNYVPNTTYGAMPQSMQNMTRAQKDEAFAKSFVKDLNSRVGNGLINTVEYAANRLKQIPQNLDKISQIRPDKSIENPFVRSLDQTARFLVGDKDQPGIFGTGYSAAEVVVPQLRAATLTPQIIGTASNNILPEEVAPYLGRLLQAYSVVKSPYKGVALGNIAVDEASDAVSRAATGKNLFEAIDSSTLPDPLKGFLKSGYNIGSGLLGAKYGMKVDKMAKNTKSAASDLQASIKAGVEDYRRTGNLQSALQAADNAVVLPKKTLGSSDGQAEVLGWNSKTKKVEKPVFKEGDIQGKINALEQSLGLAPTVEGSTLEGSRGLGKVASGIRKAKNAAESLVFGKEAVGEQGIYATQQQKLRSAAQGKLNQAMSDQGVAGAVVRNPVRALFGQAGMTDEQKTMRGKLKGQIALANDLAGKLAESVYKLTMKDPASLERIHAELDPELYSKNTTVKSRPLNSDEQLAVNQLKTASDMLNEMNYQNGFLSKQTYEKGKNGKYIARAYIDYDFAKSPQAKKLGVKPFDPLELGMFNNRQEVTDWHRERAIKDPAWLMSKRVHETLVNDAVKKYNEWAATKPEYVSDVPMKGFTKVEVFEKGASRQKIVDEMIRQQYGDVSGKELKKIRESMKGLTDNDISTYQKKIYGDLAGKYVRQDILEDVRGFYYNNQILQAVYDGLKMYNNLGVRQGLKKLKTVYNPAVRAGNRFGGVVFANFMGVNPLSFIKTYTGVKQNSKLWRALQAEGVLGTDYAKNEIRKTAMDIASPPKEQGLLVRAAKKIDDSVSSSYGKVDDKGKVAVAQVLLDRGYSFDYVVKQLRQGMQDYSVVGKAYDVSSKMPVFGKAFGKFLPNAVMIMKNGMLNRPLRMITTMYMIKAMADIASTGKAPLVGQVFNQQETEEDRKTRESRIGTSYVPFSELLVENGIPLTVQTPFGEINFGRMFGLQSLQPEKGASLYNDLLTFSPFDDSVASDVLAGPLLTAGGALKALLAGEKNSLENDFRGKSIRDPEMDKFKADTYLPKGEQLANIGSYLFRSYAPQQVNDAMDITNAFRGKEDFYGRNKTPAQAISRAAGFKLETFGKKEAQRARDKQLTYEEKQQDGQDRFDLTYTVKQAVRNGSFDPAQLDAVRTKNIQRDSYVTDKEIAKAKESDTYSDWSDDEIRIKLQVSKIKENIRNTNNLVMKDIVEEGRTNRGSREMLRAQYDELIKEGAATYADPVDKLDYIKKRLEELESKW